MNERRLAPCPASPNCVSSDAITTRQQISALQLAAPADEVWAELRAQVIALPRTRIVNEQVDYLHVECRSRIFRFIDDLELQLRPQEGVIAVRSASRCGYSDFGVNRRRVENLRDALRQHQLIS